MKKSQTIEIWKKFLKEQRSMEEKVLKEEEPFQKSVKKGYLRKRNQYLTTGPQKAGSPYSKNQNKVELSQLHRQDYLLQKKNR